MSENNHLKTGDKAPNFSVKNTDGIEISMQDFPGKFIILYFYPRDNTPGCTTEANEFNALRDEFSELNSVILGVSPDSCASHAKFRDKNNLKFTLLSDEDKKLAKKYGAYSTKTLFGKIGLGMIRSTFIIKDGRILRAFYNVKSKGHAKQILEEIKGGLEGSAE